MTINQSGWKPTSPQANEGGAPATFTGNKALMLEEALIFEIGDEHTTGVDFAAGDVSGSRHRSACLACPSRRRFGTTRASAARIMPSTSASSRSARAP
jgi:hypothetical protein